MDDFTAWKRRLSKSYRFYHNRYAKRIPRSQRRVALYASALLALALFLWLPRSKGGSETPRNAADISPGASLLALRETLYAGGYYDRLQEYVSSGGDPPDDDDTPRYPVLEDLQNSLHRSSRCPIYTYFNMDASGATSRDDQAYDRAVLAAWMVYYSSLGFNPVVLDLDDVRAKYAHSSRRSGLFGQTRFARAMLRRTDLLDNDLVIKLFTMQDHMAAHSIEHAVYVDFRLFPMTGNPIEESDALKDALRLCHMDRELFNPPGGAAAFRVDDSHVGSVSQRGAVLFASQSVVRAALTRLQRLLRRTATVVMPLPEELLRFDFGDYSQDTMTRLNPDLGKQDIGDVIDSHRHALFIESLNRRATMDYLIQPINVGTIEVVDPIALPGHVLSGDLVRAARSLAACPDMAVGLPTPNNVARADEIAIARTWALVSRARAKGVVRDSDIARLQEKVDSLKPKCRSLRVRVVDALDVVHTGEDNPEISGPAYSDSRFSLLAVPHPLVTANALNLDANTHESLVLFPYRNQFLAQLVKGVAGRELTTLPERLALLKQVVARANEYRLLVMSLEFVMSTGVSEVLEASAASLGFVPRDITTRHGMGMAEVDVEDSSHTLFVPEYAELVAGAATYEARIQALRSKMREARELLVKASERTQIKLPTRLKPANGKDIAVDQLEPVTQPIPAIAESLNSLDATAWSSARVVEAIGRRVRILSRELQDV